MFPDNVTTKAAKPSDSHIQSFRDAIDYHMKRCIPITIKSVTRWMDISPETLRLWGLFPELKEAKKLQRKRIKQAYKVYLKSRAEGVIKNLLLSGPDITCEQVYEQLECPRTSVWRDYPDVARYVSLLVKSQRSI
jgi:hypothetical protein